MIVIDTVALPKNITSIRSKKVKSAKLAFSRSNGLVEHESPELSNITPTNPFLFLQEVGEYEKDQARLKEQGNKILRCLNDIRFSLLSGKLPKQHIIYLKQTIENNKEQFRFPELQDIIAAIILRAEIELAKIEMNSEENI
ncbi:flagellar assembly protein FliX [Candidatus Trichorickettsia mobilis]|jgi:hypothetical protein|uniref:flagellar assembly protein FliX n=1 Tax=Candidatus Trichorickettsia mobilis TaxID=1346319 RepID=UPI00292CC499|nr:flagellar assembly protein FliX [Candidatus Trichorickettsia mobilis]